MSFCFRKALAVVLTAGITVLPASSAFAQGSQTATPIKHRNYRLPSFQHGIGIE